jgi:hypothetical protein
MILDNQSLSWDAPVTESEVSVAEHGELIQEKLIIIDISDKTNIILVNNATVNVAPKKIETLIHSELIQEKLITIDISDKTDTSPINAATVNVAPEKTQILIPIVHTAPQLVCHLCGKEASLAHTVTLQILCDDHRDWQPIQHDKSASLTSTLVIPSKLISTSLTSESLKLPILQVEHSLFVNLLPQGTMQQDLSLELTNLMKDVNYINNPHGLAFRCIPRTVHLVNPTETSIRKRRKLLSGNRSVKPAPLL